MNQKKIDIFIALVFLVFVVCLIGMLLNVWYLVFIPIPIAYVLFLMLSVIESLKANMKIIMIFSTLMVLIFLFIGIGATDTNPTFWGFSLGAGVIVYILWPFATISGLIYAFINK